MWYKLPDVHCGTSPHHTIMVEQYFPTFPFCLFKLSIFRFTLLPSNTANLENVVGGFAARRWTRFWGKHEKLFIYLSVNSQASDKISLLTVAASRTEDWREWKHSTNPHPHTRICCSRKYFPTILSHKENAKKTASTLGFYCSRHVKCLMSTEPSVMCQLFLGW